MKYLIGYIVISCLTFLGLTAYAEGVQNYPCDWDNSPIACARIAYNVNRAGVLAELKGSLEEANYKVFLLETMLKQDNVIVSNNLKATNSNRNRNTSISSSAAYSSADREQGV